MSNHQPSPHHGHGIESNGMVPTGWKRDLINGRIVYITPSNCALWSLDEVVGYLLSEGTCKCGLDCPLMVHQVFNFDPCTCLNHAQPGTFDTLTSNANLCNHKRKVTSIQSYQNELYQKNQAAELEQMYHQRNQSLRQDGIVTTAEMIQDGNVAPGHPVIQQPQGVHYSLIVPTQQATTTILMSSHPQEQQMILSPHPGQLMSFGTIGHHHPHHGHPHHGHSHHGHPHHGHPRLNHGNLQPNHDNRVQHHQQHPSPMISGSMFEKQKKGVKKRNKSKMKTVAAMLKMKS